MSRGAILYCKFCKGIGTGRLAVHCYRDDFEPIAFLLFRVGVASVFLNFGLGIAAGAVVGIIGIIFFFSAFCFLPAALLWFLAAVVLAFFG